MKLNKKEVKPIKDACGDLYEMYNSENLSMSFAEVNDKTKPHKHLLMEEVYFIIEGKGLMNIGSESFEIEAGDRIAIPKNEFHSIVKVEEPIKLIVVTNPGFDKDDLIEL